MEQLKRFNFILLTKYDTKKSFYNKASVTEFETEQNNKIYILKSYDSNVCAITETPTAKYYYLNDNIKKELLTSQTTLRHIKEFLKQFYKLKEYTKAEILKDAIIKPFDFIEIRQETDQAEQVEISSQYNYNLATSTETMKFFKSLGTKQTQRQDKNGKYLFTSRNG
ncbi:hypothetical protein J6Q66_08835 [bacterium]|nr:hypothetical protein [bacterium]